MGGVQGSASGLVLPWPLARIWPLALQRHGLSLSPNVFSAQFYLLADFQSLELPHYLKCIGEDRKKGLELILNPIVNRNSWILDQRVLLPQTPLLIQDPRISVDNWIVLIVCGLVVCVMTNYNTSLLSFRHCGAKGIITLDPPLLQVCSTNIG